MRVVCESFENLNSRVPRPSSSARAEIARSHPDASSWLSNITTASTKNWLEPSAIFRPGSPDSSMKTSIG